MIRPCCVCESADRKVLFRQTFSQLSDGSSLIAGYDVVACSNCGFCFADGIPPQASFDKYYREMSKYEKTESGGEDSSYDRARYEKMAGVILKLLADKNTRILEIGCANGQLLGLLKKAGYLHVSGVDPSPVCAETAWKKYGIPVKVGTLTNLPIVNGDVDFLILAGVLEHVRDLNSALEKIRNVLYEGSHVFISVPDASRYAEGQDAPFQEFSLEHINFFGPVSLGNLMRANGFSEKSIEQDFITSNVKTTTPVIHGFYEKEARRRARSIISDGITERGLGRYIEQSNLVNENVLKIIEKICIEGTPIIVWGTGAHTLRLMETSKLGEANLKLFVDSNPRYQGKKLRGIAIVPPDEIKGRGETILISSRVYQEEIANQIRDMSGPGRQVIKLYLE